MVTRRATRSAGLGPTARTLALLAMGLASGLTMLIATFVALGAGRHAADALASRALPAAIALRDLSVAAGQAQGNFLTGVHANDPRAQSAALAAAMDAGRARDEAWRDYGRVAVSSPDEQSLLRTYEASLGRERELHAAIATTPPDDPARTALLAEAQAAFATQMGALNTLENDVYLPMALRDAVAAAAGIGAGRMAAALSYGIGGVLFGVLGMTLLGGARRDQRLLVTEAAAMRLMAERAGFESSLQAGLEMAPTEDASFDVVSQALSIAAPDVPAEMLLADSSRAHFRQVLCTGSGEENRCLVNSPGECPAVAAGQTRQFEDSASLDTCRFLREQGERAWAVCVPVSIAGRHTGVIRAQHRLGAPPTEQLAGALELIARKTGDRIGALRVLAKTQAQAQVDPLTGLPNRRTLEEQVRDLQIVEGPYVVGFADLDHFKAINDLHGHDTGDRALRLFARVLRDGIRPRDLLARHGGEEFVVVLPDCSIPDARAVAERIRSALARALGNATVPAFTVTIGLAAAEPGDDLAAVIGNADRAMLTAKMNGRDRVFAARGEPSTLESAERPTAAV